jgi:hypothetical protein
MPMNMDHYILDENHNVVKATLMEWAQFFERIENRTVAWTQVNSEITVSTVFLGIDHRFSGKGPPILFETMVFGGERDQYTTRYCSWDDAETGHKVLVERLRAKQRISS